MSDELRLVRAESLEELRADWDELALRSRNVFGTWEWISTWWRHFGAGRPLAAAAALEPDGGVAAILPLYLWSRGPARILRFIGHGPSDELGPICAPEARTPAAVALARLVQGVSPQVFLGEELPGDHDWRRELGGKIVTRTPSPVARLSQWRDWDELLAARSANFRQQVRRRERALARDHELRYRLADDPGRLGADLDILFSLHRDRWGESPWFAPLEDFHREFAAVALERGWLRLWLLELDGDVAAAWYGFRFAGIESYYQAGRAPRWANSSVGFVLLAHSLREALREGMDEYRFLRGGEPFKYRFADDDPGLVTLAWASGPAGRAVLAARRLRRSLPSLRRARR